MATTSYDEVPYPGFPYAQSHPDRLATLAMMYGMRPAPIERCRVLELGCGQGANLIPVAFEFPESEFVGIDLSEPAIEEGREFVAGLGLTNIRMDAADIMDLGSDLGEFDYIIAHGVYSWVPDMVRDRVLSIGRAHLAREGVMFVSYNALPGCEMRVMLRDMLLFHLRRFSSYQERLEESFRFLHMLLDAPESPDNPAPGLIKDEIRALVERKPQVLFHDELSDIYFPLTFTDFIAHAATHHLKFVSEANIYDTELGKFSTELQEKLHEYTGGDRILREQYMDFLKCRKFRQTLLCHDDVQITDVPTPDCVTQVYAASSASPVSENPDFTGEGVEEFKGHMGAAMKTAHPMAKTAVGKLTQIWPAALHFDELLAVCRESNIEADPDALKEILFTTYRVGLVELHAARPQCVARAGPHPATSALARFQAMQGPTITTLRHSTIEATGDIERRLLTLLDGTRDRQSLASELASCMNPAPSPEKLLPELEKNLGKLARFGLLIA